jgi:hypothetical protein
MLRQKFQSFPPHSAMHGPSMQQNEIGAFTKRFNVNAHLAHPPFHIVSTIVALTRRMSYPV